jgi:hypothetical protein
MATAKDIIVKPINSSVARSLVKKLHYSGKFVNNSSLHFGVFLNGSLEGVMSLGTPTDKRKVLPLVSGTLWNEMLELNRMAFSEKLPRNSESRALKIAFLLIKKQYPQIKWILSFADGCQCGDGTIYRASGFVLTSIKKNTSIGRLADGSVVAKLSFQTKVSDLAKNNGKVAPPKDFKTLEGFQFRYIYFIDKAYKKKLTVPIVPFSQIEEIGATMYKGKKILRVKQAMRVSNPTAEEHNLPTRSIFKEEGYNDEQ